MADKHLAVLAQSSAGDSPMILHVPFAKAEKISALCETDLSPGTLILPTNDALETTFKLSSTYRKPQLKSLVLTLVVGGEIP